MKNCITAIVFALLVSLNLYADDQQDIYRFATSTAVPTSAAADDLLLISSDTMNMKVSSAAVIGLSREKLKAYIGSFRSNASERLFISTSSGNIDLESESLNYDNAQRSITASGRVKIKYHDMELEADSLHYYRETGDIHAIGSIEFKRDNYSITASTMYYNISTSSGTVFNASVTHKPLFVYAEEVRLLSRNELFVPAGDITTCDHKPPHYRFNGKNIHLKMDSRFSSYSTLLFIRGIPAFYYPYYTRRLGPRKLEISMDIGSSSSEGTFIKSKVLYPFTPNSKTYIGLDYMTVRGVGYKLGHSYSKTTGASNIDLYYIRENISTENEDEELEKTGYRDTGRVYATGWQEIVKHLSVRYRTEYTSNFLFNQLYDRESEEYKKRNLYYQMGLEYSRDRYIMSVSGDKTEDWEDDEYKLKRLVVPYADFTLYPVYMPAKLRFSLNLKYRNEYQISEEYWSPETNWNAKIDRTFSYRYRPFYAMTITPGIGFEGTAREDEITRYISYLAGTRHTLMRMIIVDADYKLKKEEEDPFLTVEHKVNYKLTLKPLRYITVSSESGYDLREEVEFPKDDFFNRLSINYRFMDIYVQNRYDPYLMLSKEWLYELNLFKRSATRIKYNYSEPDKVELTQNLSFRLRDLTIGVGARLEYQRLGGKYFLIEDLERTASIKGRLHCWESELKLLRVGDETEFWLLFNIEAFKIPRIGMFGNISESDYRYVRE